MNMKRMKKTISLSLALLFLLALLPMGSGAAEIVDSGYCGGEGDGTNLTWTLDSDGVLTISGSGKMADYSHYSYSDLGPWQSSSPKTAVIQNGVTSIGDWAFYICSSLTDVSIPDSVTSIGDCAFDTCSSLISVNIPDSVTSIGSYAFDTCSSLTCVNIPNSVTSIGGVVFDGCSSLTEINVAVDNQYYSSTEGILFNKNKTELTRYPAGKQGGYTVPNSVTSIGDTAFNGCSSLTDVSIPNSVTSIGVMAFYECSALADVYYTGSEAQWKAISFELYNDPLLNATIHYNAANSKEQVGSVEVDAQTLPTAYRYVPYHGYLSSTIEGSTFSLVSGSLPDGLSLNPYGVVTGLAKELGGFSFKVRETDGKNSTEYSVTMFVYVQAMTDVKASNWPGYGFVETAENHGRVQDQHVSSREELRDQIMYCEAPFHSFKELYIDAKVLTRNKDYYAEEGSTKLTILAETIGDFGGGTHTVAAEFRSEIGESIFTVQNYTVTGIASKEVHVTVEGTLVLWTDAEPYIDTNNRTMTPFRAVGEALGLSVAWDSATREASFTDGAKTIYFPIGSTMARGSDGSTVTMDTSAVIVNGRTYAPIRYLAEFFGRSVAWDGKTRTAVIE